MLKKIINIILIFLIIGMYGDVSAAELKTTLDVIQKASETKYLENDQGYVSKTIVNSNKDTGEVTIELKLSNTAKQEEKSTDTEVFLVVDNSGSMGYTTSTGEIRREIITKSMKNLVNNIYDNSSKVKVGLVRFANTGSLLTGSTALMCKLTDNKQTMLNAISEYENLDTSIKIDGVEMAHCESGTNIEAGLKRANDNFTKECKNKILVLLTDGIPNASINYLSSSYVYSATKTRLKSIGDSGVSVISLMTGVTSKDEDVVSSDPTKIVEQIFGTTTNPTTGIFYNIKDANLESVVTKDIYADVMEKVQNAINTTKVVDYFPQDIAENFEFSYVENPNIGTASEGIDEETKTITWDIGTLKGDEVATLKYKLKIKDMKNTKLLNKTITTNEKVVLTYKDIQSKDYKVELTSSPKVQLSEVKDELSATVNYDPTTSTTGKVMATIKTNKKVNQIDGWTISEDGMTLTKYYSSNAKESVHLVDIDGMTKDVVIEIGNIIKEDTQKDNTISTGSLPYTGINVKILISIIIITVISIIIYKKYNSYKDVK